jgi:hypothetical protein
MLMDLPFAQVTREPSRRPPGLIIGMGTLIGGRCGARMNGYRPRPDGLPCFLFSLAFPNRQATLTLKKVPQTAVLTGRPDSPIATDTLRR